MVFRNTQVTGFGSTVGADTWDPSSILERLIRQRTRKSGVANIHWNPMEPACDTAEETEAGDKLAAQAFGGPATRSGRHFPEGEFAG